MVEYGQGVSQGTEVATGGGGGGGGVNDVGGAATDALGDMVGRVAALPPEMLLLAAVAVIVGLIVLRRAF